jgi:hypothetical protein
VFPAEDLEEDGGRRKRKAIQESSRLSNEKYFRVFPKNEIGDFMKAPSHNFIQQPEDWLKKRIGLGRG